MEELDHISVQFPKIRIKQRPVGMPPVKTRNIRFDERFTPITQKERGRSGSSNAILERWRELPVWSIEDTISGIIGLKTELEKNTRMVEEHDNILTHILNENIEMKKEIQELKSQLINIGEKGDLWRESDESADMLERIFNTSNIEIKSAEQALYELGGILKDCKKEGVDSVTMVHSARGE